MRRLIYLSKHLDPRILVQEVIGIRSKMERKNKEEEMEQRSKA